jgi:predicted house-cleaning noncanonical NTP pyrophosphatase (MazG superfamily)
MTEREKLIDRIIRDIYANSDDWLDALTLTYEDYLKTMSLEQLEESYEEFVDFEEKERREIVNKIMSNLEGTPFLQQLGERYLATLTLEEIKQEFGHLPYLKND